MDSRLASHFWDETADAVVAADPSGRIQAWNPAAQLLFGYSVSEAMGQPLRALLFPSEREPASSLPRENSVYEALGRRKDGSLVQVNISRRVILDAAQQPCGTLYSQRDVTQLKVARDARLVETRFGALLESVPDAMLIVNAIGRIVLANSHAGHTFAYDTRELLGQRIEVLLPERFRGSHLHHRSMFASQPRARAMGRGLELYGLRRDGHEFPVEISLSPLATEEGVMVMSAVRDISDRKKAEQKFRGLLEAAPDAMVIVDCEGRIALVNSQMERLFGYARSDLVGQPVEMLVPDRYRDQHTGHRNGFFGQPRARAMGAGLQLYGRRCDGSEFPVEISLSPLETEEGVFVTGAIRDATERRLFEKTLQDASRLKSEFLANMSHELRTPLNGIIGFSEILVDGKAGELNAAQKEFLGDVLASGRHLLRLINEVLDLSKIEAGRMDVLPERFVLRAAIDEACAVASNAASNKSIDLQVHVPREPVEVTLDRHKFMQILFNLLSNAFKFTDDHGHVTLSVTRDTDKLRVDVQDSGVGIRAQDLPKLFVEFQQLDSGAGRRHEGTGLGLALTRRLAELQGGSVHVESTPGIGSRFTVVLPLPAERGG